MMQPFNVLDSTEEQSIQELREFLSIASVSTDPGAATEVERCAQWLEQHLVTIGMPSVRIIKTARHPLVYAEDLSAGPEKPTILFYGHYDVQPVDPLHLWTQPPFDPVIKNGKVYARGATDDKGQVFVHVKALQAMYASEGALPLNVKVLIEGEEEIGSPNLAPYVREHAKDLACDAVVVSDTAMFAPQRPSIVYGLRGLAYVEITVTGPNRDLHSGSYGGPVANPLNALCTIIASMKDSTGRMTMEGFYDDVDDLSADERASLGQLEYSTERLHADVGVRDEGGEKAFSIVERLWARPTLDVNGILGGFTGEGAKTVLPSTAMAKVSMRLVPHQRHDHIVNVIREHVAKVCPPGVTATVTDLHGADPVLVDRHDAYVQAAAQALEDTYGVPCLYQREGGSIPVVELFDSALHVPTVLMGFGLNNENAHSPDEHFDLANFAAGKRAAVRFYHAAAQLSRR
jgi:acetylornithine deacetylase/succinyl-diaminopimelate desuccinylase-like protein